MFHENFFNDIRQPDKAIKMHMVMSLAYNWGQKGGKMINDEQCHLTIALFWKKIQQAAGPAGLANLAANQRRVVANGVSSGCDSMRHRLPR